MVKVDGQRGGLLKYACTKEIILKTRNRDMENLYGLLEMSMKVSMIMMREMDSELCNGLMEVFTEDNGSTEYNMDEER